MDTTYRSWSSEQILNRVVDSYQDHHRVFGTWEECGPFLTVYKHSFFVGFDNYQDVAAYGMKVRNEMSEIELLNSSSFRDERENQKRTTTIKLEHIVQNVKTDKTSMGLFTTEL